VAPHCLEHLWVFCRTADANTLDNLKNSEEFMKEIKCPICQSQSTHYCDKNQAVYYRCGFCHAIFQHPLPTLEEMINYANTEYDDGMYKQYLSADEIKNETFSYRLDKVLEIYQKNNKSLPSNLRIFDVGCSNGRFIEIAMKRGFEAWGLEFSESAIAAAPTSIRSRIYKGDANEISKLDIGKFDIITGFDIVEHVFDPVAFLKNLRQLATENSVFVFATPDASSPIRSIMGKNWSMLQPFQHTVLLSRKSAVQLLLGAQLEPLSIGVTKKVFSADYLFGQLQAVNPTIHRLYTFIQRIIPKSLRNRKFMVNIGEMMFGARLNKG
jgi:2-polyprenyl-3-methyl-5-hydroxy-6-metoxy-1,4-benzoquinol methylase